MAAHSFTDLKAHVGHKIVVVMYGDDSNAAVECEDCNCVLLDYDNDVDEAEPEPMNIGDRFIGYDGRTYQVMGVNSMSYRTQAVDPKTDRPGGETFSMCPQSDPNFVLLKSKREGK